MQPDLNTLWDIEQIKTVKARYFRLMDMKQWIVFGAVWARNAVAGSGDDAIEGRDAIVEYIKSQLQGVRSAHHGHMPEIEVLGEGTARGTFAMFDHYEERTGDPPKGFTGFGHYYDTFVFEDGAWRIATLILKRIRIDALPGGLPDIYRHR